MALKLKMTQSNYSRLERSLSFDDKTLESIAKVLETTSDILNAYHIRPKLTPAVDEYYERLLLQKDEMIRLLTEQIYYLREENLDLRTRLGIYLMGG